MALDRKKMHETTKTTHAPEVEILPGNRPILSPIYQSAKFVLSPDHPASAQFIYTRVSNPTLRELELSLAELQGSDDCVVVGSGMAAITGALLGLLRAGDHMITFRQIYRPGRIFARSHLERFGMSATVTDLHSLDEFDSLVTPKTRLVYFETPTNPHLEIADIRRIVALARKHNLLVMLDNTFAGPHQHHGLDIDVYVHSLTKYVNGHGDIIAGAVIGKRALVAEIRQMTVNLGATLDPHAAWLIQRGLKTYHLRYERSAATTEKIAHYLRSHPRVRKVFYPGFESHPGHALARTQMTSMGGIVAFEVDPSVGTALEICQRAKLFQFTASVGSAETLICPTALFFGDDLSPEESRALGLNPYTLRISVGLEHPDDLIAELSSVLEKT